MFPRHGLMLKFALLESMALNLLLIISFVLWMKETARGTCDTISKSVITAQLTQVDGSSTGYHDSAFSNLHGCDDVKHHHF